MKRFSCLHWIFLALPLGKTECFHGILFRDLTYRTGLGFQGFVGGKHLLHICIRGTGFGVCGIQCISAGKGLNYRCWPQNAGTDYLFLKQKLRRILVDQYRVRTAIRVCAWDVYICDSAFG